MTTGESHHHTSTTGTCRRALISPLVVAVRQSIRLAILDTSRIQTLRPDQLRPISQPQVILGLLWRPKPMTPMPTALALALALEITPTIHFPQVLPSLKRRRPKPKAHCRHRSPKCSGQSWTHRPPSSSGGRTAAHSSSTTRIDSPPRSCRCTSRAVPSLPRLLVV